MSFLAIGIIFFLSVLVAAQRGPAATFAYVFLPVLLLVSVIPAIGIPILPDMSSPHAVAYGTLLGMLIAGRMPFFKLHPVDGLVLLLSVSTMATSFANGVLWTLVSSIGSELLHWLVPYYMARLAFNDGLLRRHMAIILSMIATFIAGIALIEWRLWPLFFARVLHMFGLSSVYSTMVQGRFGFFRAMATAEHPIDLGNTGLMLCALIPALAICGGLSLKDRWIRFGMIGASLMVLTSMSFSTFTGAAVALGLFAFLRYVRGSEYLLVPAMIGIILAGIVFTNHLLDVDLESIRPDNPDEAVIEGSFFTRVEIVQKSWNSYGKQAGLLGFGDNAAKKEMLLKSVDNSYMLFLVQRGWLHLALRFAALIAIGVLGTQMLRGQRSQQMRLPPAAVCAALAGTMVSMYTVWFGFVYAVLWTCMLGIAVSMRQAMQARAAYPAGRAFMPPMSGGFRPFDDGFEASPRPLVAGSATGR